MAITEEILDCCRHCCDQAHHTLASLERNEFPDLSAVTIRRRAASIAAEASFSLLRRAFFTTLDREDVWQLRHRAEQLLRECENTALHAKCVQERCSVSVALPKVTICCDMLRTVLCEFPFRLNISSAQRAVEDAYYQISRETPGELREDLVRIISLCEDLLFWLQHTLLKNG